MSASPMHYSATLPPAPGVNQTLRYAYAGNGTTRVYKTARARSWEQEAMLALRAAGFRSLPAGIYWLAIAVGVFTATGLDVDAPAKYAQDLICEALDIDDRCVGSIGAVKVPCCRAAQRLEVLVLVRPVADRREWVALSEAVEQAALCLPRIDSTA